MKSSSLAGFASPWVVITPSGWAPSSAMQNRIQVSIYYSIIVQVSLAIRVGYVPEKKYQTFEYQNQQFEPKVGWNTIRFPLFSNPRIPRLWITGAACILVYLYSYLVELSRPWLHLSDCSLPNVVYSLLKILRILFIVILIVKCIFTH